MVTLRYFFLILKNNVPMLTSFLSSRKSFIMNLKFNEYFNEINKDYIHRWRYYNAN
jgi:hypothetical protein